MTVTEIFQQAKALSMQERKELVVKLVETLGDTPAQTSSRPKTGAEIAAMLEKMAPIEFVDEDITDPVEWVKAQREKERKHRGLDWGEEE
jgi:hypothetical protein